VSGSVEHTHSTQKNILKDRTQRDPGDLKKNFNRRATTALKMYEERNK